MTPTPDPLREALAALDRILADSESQHPGGWGPDVTTVADLRIARDDIRATLAALVQPAPALDCADCGGDHPSGHPWHTPPDPLCPTCGSAVQIVSSDEGTSHYQPAPALDVERLMAAPARLAPFLAIEFGKAGFFKATASMEFLHAQAMMMLADAVADALAEPQP